MDKTKTSIITSIVFGLLFVVFLALFLIERGNNQATQVRLDGMESKMMQIEQEPSPVPEQQENTIPLEQNDPLSGIELIPEEGNEMPQQDGTQNIEEPEQDTINSQPIAIIEKPSAVSSIQYTLPDSWESSIQGNTLMLTPKEDGGYYAIGTYEFPPNTGRRAFLCALTIDMCTPQTEFVPKQIGNLSGYEALYLDASGSGPSYFAAKGSTFYMIASYGPPLPNSFFDHADAVMNSLVF